MTTSCNTFFIFLMNAQKKKMKIRAELRLLLTAKGKEKCFPVFLP